MLLYYLVGTLYCIHDTLAFVFGGIHVAMHLSGLFLRAAGVAYSSLLSQCVLSTMLWVICIIPTTLAINQVPFCSFTSVSDDLDGSNLEANAAIPKDEKSNPELLCFSEENSMGHPTRNDYEAAAQAIREKRDASIPTELRLPRSILDHLPENVSDIPRTCGLLTSKEVEITEQYDAYSLRAAMAEGKLNAVEVTSAFGKRAAIAHQLTNCLTAWFLPDAIERAKWLDSELQRTGRPVGPLHGVPVSLKNLLNLKGYDASAGFLSTHERSHDTATLPQLLWEMGAVFYCKTNMPQAVMHLECESFYGRTVNPFHRSRSCGGSSGGEGALIGMRGSVLGIGTDIGGSIRQPAAVNGIYGFKASSKIFPRLGMKPPMPGSESITGVIGPMSASLRDCELFTSSLLRHPIVRHDISSVPYDWKPKSIDLTKRTLRIGIMMDDGLVRPHTAITRAMKWAQSRLEGVHGIELVPYEPYRSEDALNSILHLFFPDGGNLVRERCAASGEPIHPLTDWALHFSRELTVNELWESQASRSVFRQNFSKHWNEQGVDAVLSPAYVAPASPHNTSRYMGYTALWNLVEFPAITFPTGLSAKAGEGVEHREPWNEWERILLEKNTLTIDCADVPLSLQLIGYSYEDSDLFSIMSVLNTFLK